MIISTMVCTEQLAHIDQQSLGAGSNSDLTPWYPETFSSFRMRPSNSVIGIAADGRDDFCVGYCAYGMTRRRIQICRIAVMPQFRRRGFATNLLMTMLVKMERAVCRKLQAEIPETNYAAIKLFQGSGFLAVETSRYEGEEDRYLFQFERRPMLEPNNRISKQLGGEA